MVMTLLLLTGYYFKIFKVYFMRLTIGKPYYLCKLLPVIVRRNDFQAKVILKLKGLIEESLEKQGVAAILYPDSKYPILRRIIFLVKSYFHMVKLIIKGELRHVKDK